MSLIKGFVSIVSRNIQSSPAADQIPSELGVFALPKPLPMKLNSYIDHFLYQLDLEEKLLASSIIIIEHFLRYICLNNIHKFVFTTLVISYKAFTDHPAKNSVLEKIGVIKKGELVVLEKTVLEWIMWDLQYSKIEIWNEVLHEEAKEEDEEEEIIESMEFEVECDETDYSECERSDSFSELSVFFND